MSPVICRLAVLLTGLVLMTCLPLRSAAADGSWLDGPLDNWNEAGMEIPEAPMGLMVDPLCQAQRRPPETDADEALAARGWTLLGSYQAGWGIVAVKALSGYDGMCRPIGHQEFVFVDGAFAGTISPSLMNSREDGAGAVQLVGQEQLTASYRRYKPEDALCCPSGSAEVVFQIDRSGTVPILVPARPE
jgi:hypothetical protein